MVFIRTKKRGERTYAYIVESRWDAEQGSPRQKVLRYLGPEHAVLLADVPREFRLEPSVARWFAARESDFRAADGTPLIDRIAMRNALIAGDEATVARIVQTGFSTIGPHRFVEDVLTPLLHEVGADWFDGKLDTVDEHLVSRGVHEIIRQAQHEVSTSPPVEAGDSATVLLANPDGEIHSMALEVLACWLIADGHRVVVSAGGVPRKDLARRADELRPDVVFISVTRDVHVDEALRQAEAVLGRNHRTRVVIGGQAFVEKPLTTVTTPRIHLVPDATAREACDIVRGIMDTGRDSRREPADG